jgi:hypothetical protein
MTIKCYCSEYKGDMARNRALAAERALRVEEALSKYLSVPPSKISFAVYDDPALLGGGRDAGSPDAAAAKPPASPPGDQAMALFIKVKEGE